MIGNNSCGSHALYAGKTVDNVERLTVVEYGSDTFEVGAYDDAAYAATVAGGGRLAEVLTGLREVGRRHAERVRARFPDITPPRVSGYNLDQLLPEHGFDIARALVGTESTCAVVTEGALRLSVSPKHRRLVVLGYPDIFAAADAAPSLLRHPLLVLEGFDGTLIDQMRARPLNVEHLAPLPDGRGWLLAELGADEPDAADAIADVFVGALPAGVTWRRYDDAERQSRVWLVRESRLGRHRHHVRWDAQPRGLGGRGGRARAARGVPAGNHGVVGRVRLLGSLVRPFRPGLRSHPQQFRPTAASPSGLRTSSGRLISASRARVARWIARQAWTWRRTRRNSCPATTRAGCGRARCTPWGSCPGARGRSRASPGSRTRYSAHPVSGGHSAGWRASRRRGTFRRGPVAAARRDDLQATVVVWPDTFTDAFRPHVADDLVAVLEAIGDRVAVPSSWACCGRPL